MYVTSVPNRNSPPAILLRESYRENGKVKTRTLANLSKIPPEIIEVIKRALKGDKLMSVEEVFEITENGSKLHGHVAAVMSAMKRLDFFNLISTRRTRERDLVVAMVAARILEPKSKLATSLWWQDTTLPEILDINDADEDDLYEAMDWILKRQDRIEKKLADRHMENDGLALFDLTSSYFEGITCPLAKRGHNRDKKKGKLQVNFGLLTNQSGIPIGVSVFAGNTSDPKTVLPQVKKLQENFGIERFVLVGDRGMITQKQVDILRDLEGIDWIGALRPEAIQKLVVSDSLQIGLFDEINLFELSSPAFPGERLIACRNPELARRRFHKRESLLKATITELESVRQMVQGRRLHGRAAIAEQLEKVLKSYRIGKHYKFEVYDDGFDYEVDEKSLTKEIAGQAKGNPDLYEERVARCKRHIQAISKRLESVRRKIDRGLLWGKAAIGVRIGKVINKYKVGKHFTLTIHDNAFEYEIDKEKVAVEMALDGVYVVRTSLPETRMSAGQTVLSYKRLSTIEQAFRTFKSINLKVRPIGHRLERRVRSHIFLCMLAYYVQYHMVEAWRPLLYCDEDQESKAQRDPVAPAMRSEAADHKAQTKRLEDGSRVYDFRSLINHLSTIVRNTCRCSTAGPNSPTFLKDTTPNPKQQQAFSLIETICL